MGLFDVFKKKDCEICGKEVGKFCQSCGSQL